MKTKMRCGVFETNSSSVHSMTICSSKEYDEFEKGNLFIEKWGSLKLYTKKELIEKFESMIDWKTANTKYPNIDWNNKEEFERILEENDYCTSEKYWSTVADYETYDTSYTNENGNTIHIFGYYGFD